MYAASFRLRVVNYTRIKNQDSGMKKTEQSFAVGLKLGEKIRGAEIVEKKKENVN